MYLRWLSIFDTIAGDRPEEAAGNLLVTEFRQSCHLSIAYMRHDQER